MFFSFTNEEIRIENHIERVRSEECGAISTFIGTVRNSFQGRKVLYLEYTAYEKMAHKEMEKISETDTNFAVTNQENIRTALALTQVFLRESKLDDYYSGGNRSFIPIYFIIHFLF